MLVSPDQVPLVPEASVALRALVGLLLRLGRNVVGVVVQVLVTFQQLSLKGEKKLDMVANIWAIFNS